MTVATVERITPQVEGGRTIASNYKCSAAIATGGIAPRVKPAGYGTRSGIKPHIDERRINAIKSGIQFRSKRQSQSGIKEEDKLLQIDVLRLNGRGEE